jgi:hypothetical protein
MIPRTLNSIQENGRLSDWRRATFSTGRNLWKSTVRSYLGACRKPGHRTSSVDVHDTVTLTGVTVAQLQSHLRDFTFFSERIRNVEKNFAKVSAR